MKTFLAALLIFSTCALNLAVGAEPEVVYRAQIGADGVQRVEMTGGSYFYKPNHIIVKVNNPVELKVVKEHGMTPHNISMQSPEAGMNFDVDMKGEPKTITFTPTKTGTYRFYCTKKLLFMKSHREKGMEGVIEVVE
jgi:plastocyanin